MTGAEKDNTLCTWLLKISNGRLLVPSDDFLAYGVDMENEFNNFHAGPKRVDMEPWVIDRFTKVLVEKFGNRYDKEVLSAFSVTRTHIRIKDLNRELKNLQSRKLGMRDLKQLGQLQTFQLSGGNLEDSFQITGNSDAYYQAYAAEALNHLNS